MSNILLVKTFAGLEKLLENELIELGATNCIVLNRAVQCDGDGELMYRVNYFSRFALRVLLLVKEFNFENNHQFYNQIFKIKSETFLRSHGTLAISATAHNSIFKTPLYLSLLTKDAICDRFRELFNERPNVDKERPDVQFHIHVFENRAMFYLDSSGESLHKRGYRVSTHPAALNEIVAAAILKFSEWKYDCDVIDPMCGSATILIEAAMMALNIPAGFYRKEFGFFSWLTFNADKWKKIKKEAKIVDDIPINFYGYDISNRYLGMAKANRKEARLTDFIHLQNSDFANTMPTTTPALVIINPPYGERLEVEDITLMYKQMGNTLKHNYANCTAFIISSNFEALKQIGLHATRKISLYNGALECKVMKFELYKGKK